MDNELKLAVTDINKKDTYDYFKAKDYNETIFIMDDGSEEEVRFMWLYSPPVMDNYSNNYITFIGKDGIKKGCRIGAIEDIINFMCVKRIIQLRPVKVIKP